MAREDDERAGELLRQKNLVLEGVARIFAEALSTETEVELGRRCLVVAEDVTGAAFSFMGELNHATERLEELAVSERGWAHFTSDGTTFVDGKVPFSFKVHGLYGRVLTDGASLIANDPDAHPDRIGVPDGHPPLRSFLGVPLKKDGVTVGMIGLGNRPGGFREEDRRAAEALAPAIVQALNSKRAADALRESEERYRALFSAIDQGFCIVEMLFDDDGRAEDYRILQVNPAFERQTGLRNAVGKRMRELTPEHEQYWYDMYGRIALTGVAERFEARARALGRWYEVFAFRIGDPRERRVGALFNDIGERKRADAALRESERRLQTLVEGVPQLVWRAVDGGEWTWASRQWTDYTGQPDAQSHALGWLEPVHPDDRPSVMAHWRDAEERGGFRADYRIRHASEDRYRWFQTRATPVRDEGGEIVEWLGTSTDVDDLRSLQQRQQLLLAELQHRVRNILTVVRSVFSRTVENGGEPEDMADHFRGRLDSLARTQLVVTQSASGMVDLETLIRDELLSVGVSDGPTLTIEGPDVALPALTAESVGLAIHELTTNALKYGALRAANARLVIRWTGNVYYGGRRWIIIRWTEEGVPAVAVTPSHRGFGSELITEALPYRLGAETSLEFRGGGVRCTLRVPLPEGSSAEAPAWQEG